MSEFSTNVWFDKEIKPLEPSLRFWLLKQFKIDSMVDDVVQESYLRVLKAREKRNISYPKAYLYRTAKNVAFDYLQNKNHRLTDSIESFDGGETLEALETTHEIVDRNQEIALLKAAVRSLPDRCREVFTLRKIYGLSHREIAQRLNISEKTISAQMNIALRKCAEFIERHSDSNRPPC